MSELKALKELEQILQETRKVFLRVMETEEKLQDHIVKGEASEILELEPLRQQLQQEAQRLKDRREEILPSGCSVRSYIRDNASPGEREDFLSLFEEINNLVYQVRAHQEVNRGLLQERLRFVREMREVLFPSEKTYDPSGQLNFQEGNKNINLDQSC